jgi:hypothetical protein
VYRGELRPGEQRTPVGGVRIGKVLCVASNMQRRCVAEERAKAAGRKPTPRAPGSPTEALRESLEGLVSDMRELAAWYTRRL